MKIQFLYRPNSEHSRLVNEYVHEFKIRRNIEIEMIDIDGRDGSSLAQLYGVMAYPAILVTKEGGELVASWQGTDLPLMDELAAYANL